jgi:hypothetical protein
MGNRKGKPMRTSFLRTSAVVTVVVLTGAAGGATQARGPASGPASGQDTARAGLGRSSYSDFNADGYNDVVIAAPLDDVAGVRGAGVVHVIYGGPAGPSTSNGPGAQLWHQNIAGIDDQAEPDDHFGWAVAAGNFDGDAYGDLAIGVPGEDLEDPQKVDPPVSNHGVVHVLYGSPGGLRATDARLIGATGQASTAGSQFGYAVAAADAQKVLANQLVPGADGHTELVFGAPGYLGAGAAIILFGGAVDRTAPNQTVVRTFVGASQPGSRLGASVVAGRFYETEFDSIAVGAPRGSAVVDMSGVLHAGIVDVLDPTGAFLEIQQPGTTGDGRPEPNDHFGAALAAGDLDEDGYDDLAVGAPLEDIGARADAGLVQVFFNNADGNGLDDSVAVGLGLFRLGVPGDPRAGDHLGAAIAIADFGEPPAPATEGVRAVNLDHLDVAIGIPGRTVHGRMKAGAVAVLYRTAGGWNTSDNDLWTQDSPGVAETAGAGDGFGSALATGHLRDDTRSLIVGVPGEDVGSITDAGVVQILFATPAGLGTAAQQLWGQDSPGIADRAQPGDRFGAAVE